MRSHVRYSKPQLCNTVTLTLFYVEILKENYTRNFISFEYLI